MRILIVSQFFPPEMGAPAGRFYDFALRWIAEGHQVTVITGMPNFPAGVIHDEYRGRRWYTETIDGVTVKRGFLWTRPDRYGRPLSYASFVISATLRVLFDRGRYDCVVATIPPPSVGLPGLLAALRHRVPWVLDIRDIWPEAIVQSGRLTNPLVIRAFEAVARFLYRRAHRITTVTDGWKARLEEIGVPAGKVAVLPNGVDVRAFDEQSAAPLPEAFDALDPDARWFCYAGILNRPQGLDIVLDGMARLRERDPEAYAEAQLVFVGEGPVEAELKAQCRKLALDRVVWIPRQPRAAVFALLRRCHAVLVTLRPRKDTSTVPSKIYESLASGRPVIYQAAGEGAETIRSAGGGTVVEPGSPDALADAMLAYLRQPALAEAQGKSGRAFVEAHFDRRRIAERFSELLRNLSHRGMF